MLINKGVIILVLGSKRRMLAAVVLLLLCSNKLLGAEWPEARKILLKWVENSSCKPWNLKGLRTVKILCEKMHEFNTSLVDFSSHHP